LSGRTPGTDSDENRRVRGADRSPRQGSRVAPACQTRSIRCYIRPEGHRPRRARKFVWFVFPGFVPTSRDSPRALCCRPLRGLAAGVPTVSLRSSAECVAVTGRDRFANRNRQETDSNPPKYSAYFEMRLPPKGRYRFFCAWKDLLHRASLISWSQFAGQEDRLTIVVSPSAGTSTCKRVSGTNLNTVGIAQFESLRALPASGALKFYDVRLCLKSPRE
jgi:hypothetical protein